MSKKEELETQEDTLRAAFNEFDKHKTGKINATEIRNYLVKMGEMDLSYD